MSADLLAAGAENVFDQVVAVVVDPQGGVVDFDGDDLTGITQPDLHPLADDLGAAAARHRALDPSGSLVDQRSRARRASALDGRVGSGSGSAEWSDLVSRCG